LKLVNFTVAGSPRLGAIIDEKAIDLSQAYLAFQQKQGKMSSFPSGYPIDMLTYLQSGDKAQQAAQEVVNWVSSSYASLSHQQFVYPISKIRIDPPIRSPSKIICIGLNYADHCREQKFDIPESLILFAKFPSAVIGPGDSITWSGEVSQQVDYEAELAVVIGRKARNVPEDKIYKHIGGYTIVNDVSARDVQFADKQWVRGKSFDTFCPLGPYLVTPNDVGNPHHLAIRCWVNGELRQDSNTDQMIFKIPEAIAFINRTCTLLPGDIISTGTPDGVGVFRKPPVFLKPGDVVEIEIEKLGRLRNPIM
jgi:2-keto-4-pentenoate hydratase/2-oxohepta-3-ene-1,7-dioic acid hydratase in catechol pathway